MYGSALMASPPANGLFHRAIEQSGAVFSLLPRGPATDKGQEFVASLGNPNLAQLRDLPAAQLHAAAQKAEYFADLPIDGRFLPESPCRVFQEGRQHRVPVLIGFNADELHGYRPPLPPISSYGEFVSVAHDALARYGSTEISNGFLAMLPRKRWRPELSRRALRGYFMMGWETQTWAELVSRTDDDAYVYYFDHAPAGASAAFHTAEISFAFNNERFVPRYSRNMPAEPAREADLQLADAMSDYWVAFARSGRPEVAGRPGWAPFGGSKDGNFMSFKDGKAQPEKRFFAELSFRPLCEIIPQP